MIRISEGDVGFTIGLGDLLVVFARSWWLSGKGDGLVVSWPGFQDSQDCQKVLVGVVVWLC